MQMNTQIEGGLHEMKLRALIIVTVVLIAAAALITAKDDSDKKVQMLFVQSAQSAAISNGKLTLTGISPTTVFFSDRPKRIAGHLVTSEMIPLWSEGKNSFMKDPPNATLSTFKKSDGKVSNLVIELMNPQLAGDTMTYDVKVLQGNPSDITEAASLFIDVIGMPLTPVSYAGVARRTTRRAIVY